MKGLHNAANGSSPAPELEVEEVRMGPELRIRLGRGTVRAQMEEV